MKTQYLELYIDKGTTFNKVVTVEDITTDNPVNVANYSFSSQTRRSYYSSNASGNITCTITSASDGKVTLSMTKANTSNMVDGRHYFDVVGIDNSTGTTYKMAEGIAIVKPTVTR